jgi:hypothetical protein
MPALAECEEVLALEVEVLDVEAELFPVVEAVACDAAVEAVVVVFCVLDVLFPFSACKAAQLTYVTPGHAAVHSYVDLYASVLLTLAG